MVALTRSRKENVIANIIIADIDIIIANIDIISCNLLLLLLLLLWQRRCSKYILSVDDISVPTIICAAENVCTVEDILCRLLQLLLLLIL